MLRDEINKIQAIEDKVIHLGKVIPEINIKYSAEEHRLLFESIMRHYYDRVIPLILDIQEYDSNKFFGKNDLEKFSEAMSEIDTLVGKLDAFLETQAPIDFNIISLDDFRAAYRYIINNKGPWEKGHFVKAFYYHLKGLSHKEKSQ